MRASLCDNDVQACKTPAQSFHLALRSGMLQAKPKGAMLWGIVMLADSSTWRVLVIATVCGGAEGARQAYHEVALHKHAMILHKHLVLT